MRIIEEQFRFVRSPKSALAELAEDPRAIAIGFRHVLWLAVLWECAVLLWAVGGATPTMPAFLKIPDDQYYFSQLIFMIPMFVIVWLLASSIAYVLSNALGGDGSYDAILGGFGIAAPVSGYFALIPDFIQGALWTTGWVSFAEYQRVTTQWPLVLLVIAYLAAYVGMYIYLYAATIYYSRGLSKPRSVVVALVSFFTSAGLFVTVVR